MKMTRNSQRGFTRLSNGLIPDGSLRLRKSGRRQRLIKEARESKWSLRGKEEHAFDQRANRIHVSADKIYRSGRREKITPPLRLSYAFTHPRFYTTIVLNHIQGTLRFRTAPHFFLLHRADGSNRHGLTHSHAAYLITSSSAALSTPSISLSTCSMTESSSR